MKTIGTRRLAVASLFAAALAASALAYGGVESRMFELRYADATEVAANFNRTWRGGSVLTNCNWSVGDIAVPFAEANSVMVTAPVEILDVCAKMVERIDRKPRQVYIEARFVELANTAMYNLGLNWSSLSDFGIYGNIGGAISKQRIPDNITKYSQQYKARSSGAAESYEFSKGGIADNSYFYGTLSSDQMRLVLMAFQGSQDFKTFSNPKVIVTSGKEAIVDMTTKRPNVTLSAKRVLNGSNNTLDVDSRMAERPGRDNLMFAHEAFFSWGVTLSVLPRVMTNGLSKVKQEDGKPEKLELSCDVTGKTCIIIDDFILTGNTIAKAAKLLYKKGAKTVLACATHGLFTKDAVETIKKSGVKDIVVSNTVEQDSKLGVNVVDILPIIIQNI